MIRYHNTILAGALCLGLVACNSPADAPATDAAQAEAPMATASAESAPAPAPVSATREDVIQALRCHAVLSSAMANQIVVGGDGSAVVGIREQTRWFSEAQRRAEAAGMPESEFNALMAETRAPMTTEAQQAENRPVMEQCLANLPPL